MTAEHLSFQPLAGVIFLHDDCVPATCDSGVGIFGEHARRAGLPFLVQRRSSSGPVTPRVARRRVHVPKELGHKRTHKHGSPRNVAKKPCTNTIINAHKNFATT